VWIKLQTWDILRCFLEVAFYSSWY
jgi:hypothetical protein